MRVNQPAFKKLARFFLENAARLRHRVFGDICIVLFDDRGITRVNRLFLHRARPTDVISFHYLPQPGRKGRCHGEIILNVQRACKEGKKRSGSGMELALYLAHGCDHMAGFGDYTAADRLRMRRRELRWLRQARKLNLFKFIIA